MRYKPTNKALKRLQTELQANVSLVETDLSGENHGFLALVLIDEQYAQISHTKLFVVLDYLPPLIILLKVTRIEALELKERYADSKRLYLEWKNIEKALLCHIPEAIEDKYIVSLVNKYTNLLSNNIPAVMHYLFFNYNRVRSEEVAEKE